MTSFVLLVRVDYDVKGAFEIEKIMTGLKQIKYGQVASKARIKEVFDE